MKYALIGCGMICANHIRAALEAYCAKHSNIRLYLPDRSLCGDNGAMIGAQAYFEFLRGVRADTTLNARAVME